MQATALEPFGLMLEADSSGDTLLSLDPDLIRELIDQHLLLLFRGYPLVADADYISFARQFGDLLAWEFGEILELTMQEQPANHIFGRGRVELHWDGAYVEHKPHYNLFQCLTGATPDSGGETLFVSTPRLLNHAAEPERQHWRTLILEYRTEKKAHYGGHFQSPLVCNSPYNQGEVIRYIEPFNEDNAAINPVDVQILGMNRTQGDDFLHQFNQRLYADDVIYRHGWCTGDFLLADNSRLLHGRSRFLDHRNRRHIKRINIL